MIWLLKFLLFGHIHEWKIINERILTGGGGIGTRYILQCKKCGNIKRKDCI